MSKIAIFLCVSENKIMNFMKLKEIFHHTKNENGDSDFIRRLSFFIRAFLYLFRREFSIL